MNDYSTRSILGGFMESKKCIRKSGILAHPTSFPCPYGIGELGESAYEFVDFLVQSGQKLWQILPLGPTGFGDSPYQSFSSFAGQPLLISLGELKKMNLLKDEDFIDMPPWNPNKIDYGPLITFKTKLLRKAFSNFISQEKPVLKKAFYTFCEKEEWLLDYALFMAVKDAHDGCVWTEWQDDIAFPTKESLKHWKEKLQHEIMYYQFIQFLFFRQWEALKEYANNQGIEIIGDIPIFVAFDSADVWSNKSLYQLDSNGYPIDVAGVPPDYFSETGQLWGNPLYKWEEHKKTSYDWWIHRISHSLRLVDILRIDHFRGFESYWAVPYGSPNAIIGEWRPGPNKELFIHLEKALGKNLPIIAEDLGIITDEVKNLRDSFYLPGMKVLQFGFEDLKDNDFLPHNISYNSICYSGTHDNDTSLGWYLKASEEVKDRIRKYMNTDGMNIAWDFIRICFGTTSSMAIVPIQDLLSLNSEHRMNTPGVASGNWQFRYTSNQLTNELADRLASLTNLFGR